MDQDDKGKATAKSEEQPSRLKQLVSALSPLRIPVKEQASSSPSSSHSTQTLSPLDSPLRLRDPASSSLSAMQFTPASESPVKRMLRQQTSFSPTKEKVQESREFSSSSPRAPYSRPQVLPHPDHDQHYEHQHHGENEYHEEEGEGEEDAQGHTWYYSPTCLVITGALLAFFIAFIVWFIVTSVHVLKHHEHHHSAF